MIMLSPWAQLAQAFSFFGLTFASEDAALFGAAALVGTQNLHWAVALAAVFLGIWAGDLALYGLARKYGKALLNRFSSAEKLARGEAWFANHGWGALWLSRFVPGLRLPTLLAAGLLKANAGVFGAITAAAGAMWVGGIIGAAALLSESQTMRIAKWLHDAWWLVALVLGIVLLRPLLRRGHNAKAACIWCRVTAFTQRIWQWEFWPTWLFYAPVGVYYLWLGLRFRGFSLPAIANPGFTCGGLVGESKHEILHILRDAAPKHTADGWLVGPADPERRIREFDEIRAENAVEFPLVLKPDVGQRGAGVRIIRNHEAAAAYLASVSGPVLLQRYAPGPREIGVFYYRFPGQGSPTCGERVIKEPGRPRPEERHGAGRPGSLRGCIFAITEKVFPFVTGDGERTLAEIILTHPRARLIAGTYLKRFAARRNDVLANGERLQLVEAGNHAQGCIFLDGMHLLTPELEAAVDGISRRIPGFFIGRYDLRYASDEDLRAGRFTIVELNGSGAEATSIYDARNSLFAAYRTLFRQWRLVFEIGAANRALGTATPTIGSLFRAWRENSALVATYPIAD
jgi:membrane protein DedA with SNARE-associated domain